MSDDKAGNHGRGDQTGADSSAGTGDAPSRSLVSPASVREYRDALLANPMALLALSGILYLISLLVGSWLFWSFPALLAIGIGGGYLFMRWRAGRR